MNKKISLGAALALIVFIAAAAVFITMGISAQVYRSQSNASSERASIINKLTEVDSIISENYVGEIDNDKLTKGVMDGYFAGLGDEHSYYLTADEYNETILNRSGKSAETGIYITDDLNGGAYIYYVMNGSPADSAGLKKGDVITAVAGTKTKGIGFDEIVRLIKSQQAAYDITVTRGTEELTVNVAPEEFKITTIEAKILELGNIGYIRIYSFVDSTDEQFSDAVETMLRQNVSGFIFDVRHNDGGTLSSVVSMIDKLCPAGPIVYKVDGNGEATVMHKSDADEVSKPMLVLIDEETASASELFACALRDYEKAQLIGTKSYGKGSMQDLFAFKDGSAISITTSLFNPPYSENFDGVGLTPDFEVALDSRIENFFLASEEDDSQLQYAIQKMMETTGVSADSGADAAPDGASDDANGAESSPAA